MYTSPQDPLVLSLLSPAVQYLEVASSQRQQHLIVLLEMDMQHSLQRIVIVLVVQLLNPCYHLQTSAKTLPPNPIFEERKNKKSLTLRSGGWAVETEDFR